MRISDILFSCFVLSFFSSLGCSTSSEQQEYFNYEAGNILTERIYVEVTTDRRINVVHADTGKASKASSNYSITHVDGIELFVGSLARFLSLGDDVACVPIIDDEDNAGGGSRLLGFLKVQSITYGSKGLHEHSKSEPKQDEGKFSVTDRSSITEEDSNVKSGKCIDQGVCCLDFNNFHLSADYRSGISADNEIQPLLGSILRNPHKDCMQSGRRNDQLAAVTSSQGRRSTEEMGCPGMLVGSTKGSDGVTRRKFKGKARKKYRTASRDELHQTEIGTQIELDPTRDNHVAISILTKMGHVSEMQNLPNSTSNILAEAIAAPDDDFDDTAQKAEVTQIAKGEHPEAYLAGKPPNELVHLRQQMAREGKPFRYAVRFRIGPLGISFNNKIPDSTVIERVVAGMQSALSDIMVSDVVVRVNEVDTSNAPAKVTQRIISTLSFPFVVEFETRPPKSDADDAEASKRKRLFELSIIYPPTLVSVQPIPILLAEWTAFQLMSSNTWGANNRNQSEEGRYMIASVMKSSHCEVFLLRTAQDLFGCSVGEQEFSVPGSADNKVDDSNSMLSLLTSKASLEYGTAVRPIALMKRGVCTFVEKAKGLSDVSADYGIVVNTDDSLLDMPAGKEDTKGLHPLFIMKKSDGHLLHQSALKGEVLAILSDPTGPSKCADHISALASDVLNRWPHSVPAVSADVILATAPSEKMRSMNDEGGRIAVSGENGWVYLDYHLALFGPSSLPKGAHSLQMANPPYGCDPNAYTVRVKGAVVAILRGGGCSFGIKVMNAQKLGAVAVVVVNDAEQKNIRIMASEDEIPLINIPCILVTKRLQHVLKTQLTRYHLSNEHLIAFQPTGIFGDYDFN